MPNNRITLARRPLAILAGVGALLGSGPAAWAWDASSAWADGTITMILQMDRAGSPTPSGSAWLDGSTSWNVAVAPALDAWNTSMVRTKFASSTANPTPSDEDGQNSMFFASTIFGQPFGSNVLAVTSMSSSGESGVRLVEADITFNTAVSWNSYRGNLRVPEDVRRVALHELGHVIGLDHPDQAFPVQSVNAIMNATISNLDALVTDDRNGASALYGSALPLPTITRQPQSKSVAVGGNATLDVQVAGTTAPAGWPVNPLYHYMWKFTPIGRTETNLVAMTDGTAYLGAAQLDDRGSYRVRIETPNGNVTSSSATVSVSAVATSTATKMTGLATRGIAGVGTRVMTVGFTIQGGGTRRLLVRGKGPRLAAYGVPNTVADPVLRVFNAAGTTQLAMNDNWQDGGQGAAMASAFTEAQLDDFINGSKDSALVVNLGPGVYTAQLQSNTGGEGIALIEVYDLDKTAQPAGRLIGLSTRSPTGTGSDALTGGLIVDGTVPRTFLIRSLGESLTTFGVTGVLEDPTITLYSLTGGAQKVRLNDEWSSPSFLQAKLTGTATTLGLTPATLGEHESAIQVTLAPGPYTVEVRGWNNSTGVTLLEIYECAD